MTSVPVEAKTRTAVLIGSRAVRVRNRLGESLPVPYRVVESLRELRNQNCLTFIIYCPEDHSELNLLYSGISDSALSRETFFAFIAPFSLIGFSIKSGIVLRENDFAFRLLPRISGMAGVSVLSSMLSNLLIWERSGALLPFFIHNMNNILARILGNIELAEFYSGNAAKTKEKLANAIDGAEDMKEFLAKLSNHSSFKGNYDDLWTPGDERGVLEMGQMSSGTSVEFTYTKSGEIPEKLPIKKWTLNSLLGILSAAATISVNGCGAVQLESVQMGETVSFKISWNRSSRDNLSERNQHSMADLISTAAVLASHSGILFRLDEWSNDRGDVLVDVPLNSENHGL